MMRALRSSRGAVACWSCVRRQHASAQEARDWLERMNRAVEDLNYRGTFVHVLDGTAETLHIVHRNEDGQERRAHPVARRSGPRDHSPGRSSAGHSAGPAHRAARDAQRRESARRPRCRATPPSSSRTTRSRSAAPRASRNVPAQVLEIKPRDEFRYGYMLWLDQETAMPLQSQLIDEQGRGRRADPVHGDRDAGRHSGRGARSRRSTPRASRRCARPSRRRSPPRFRGARRPCPAASSCRSPRRARSRARKRPSSISSIPTASRPYRCSSKIPKTKAEVGEGFSTVGSTNAFSLTLRGRKVTAMGEVPRQTVRTIASSLVSE